MTQATARAPLVTMHRYPEIIRVASEYGVKWLFWRLAYEFVVRTGYLKRALPPAIHAWHPLAAALGVPPERLSRRLVNAWRSERGQFFLPEEPREYRAFVGGPENVVESAEEILSGRLLLFHRLKRNVGTPPDWMLGSKTDIRWPNDVHWSTIPDLSPLLGDIKFVWESSRFGHLYTLVRAYALNGDERYVEAFWSHIESWSEVNRIELGPHWRCGQEISFRGMAWIFALYAFHKSPASTDERIALLLEQLWHHARHVERMHWYATRCVRNNHALSEAAFLFTLGTALPFLPGASRMQAKGLQCLSNELGWQVYDDGTYIQHSMNYARLVCQLLTWTLCVAGVNRIRPPQNILRQSRRLLSFLLSVQDTRSGRVPNYGPNDGALIFPLSSCDYLDYRPSLKALHQVLEHTTIYDPGPWDEEAVWFVGSGARRPANEAAPGTQPASRSFDQGGYYTLRGSNTYACIRCASYRHRPSQADMLHLDVWYHGHNLLIDPGTLSYNLDDRWSGYFNGTASHNTVTVDGSDQMTKGHRFMWHGWTRSQTIGHEVQDGNVRFEGEHYGYHPVIHRRKILLSEDLYLVIDDLNGDQTDHTFRLHWLVNDFSLHPHETGATILLPGLDGEPLRLAVLSSERVQTNWARAEEGTPRGWQSQYYGEALPAWSLEVVTRGPSVRFLTLVGPEERVQGVVSRVGADLTGLALTLGAPGVWDEPGGDAARSSQYLAPEGGEGDP